MSFVTITTTNGLIRVKATDVALVALQDPAETGAAIYLADGRQFATASTPAEVAGTVNAVAGPCMTTVIASENFGNCYIGGNCVLYAEQFFRAAVEGTNVILRGGPGPVVCPTVATSVMYTLLNETTAGGSNSGLAWDPTITPAAGTAAVVVGTPTYTRVGDVVTLDITMTLNIDNLATASVALTDLPFDALATSTAIISPFVVSGDASMQWSVVLSGAPETVTLAADSAATGATETRVALKYTYTALS